MIDIENEIFTRIAKALRKEFPGIYVTGEQGKTPAKFPAMSVVQMDNPVYKKTLALGSTEENHAEPMFQIDGYSNKTAGRKSECKALMAAADRCFSKLGFTRTYGPRPTPNMADATIYRMTARYEAVVSKNKIIFRR